jgi:hypothetical protein
VPRRNDEQQFKRHQKVVAAVDLSGVPAGTKGKIQIVNGLSWIRYWVVFANGVELGQLGNDDLTTPAQWDAQADKRRQAQRAAEADERRARYLAGQSSTTSSTPASSTPTSSSAPADA